jgi:hypothetical protein
VRSIQTTRGHSIFYRIPAAARAGLQGKLLWLYIKGFKVVTGVFSLSVVDEKEYGSGQTVKYTHGQYVRQVKTRNRI